MNIYKNSFTVWTLNGKQVDKDTPGAVKEVRETARWYGRIKDANGKWKAVPLYTDKAASLAKFADLIRQQERGEVGLNEMDELRQRQVERLEHCLTLLAPKIEQGDTRALLIAVKANAEINRLHGLYL